MDRFRIAKSVILGYVDELGGIELASLVYGIGTGSLVPRVERNGTGLCGVIKHE